MRKREMGSIQMRNEFWWKCKTVLLELDWGQFCLSANRFLDFGKCTKLDDKITLVYAANQDEAPDSWDEHLQQIPPRQMKLSFLSLATLEANLTWSVSNFQGSESGTGGSGYFCVSSRFLFLFFLLPQFSVFSASMKVFLGEQPSPDWHLSSSWDVEAATNYYSLSLSLPSRILTCFI